MNVKVPTTIAALLLGAACCHADTLGSFATGAFSLGNINTATNFAGMSATNTVSGGVAPTFFLDPAGVWEAASPHSTWVGYAPTAGPLSGVNPPGTIGAPEFYTFTTTFSAFGPWSGTLTVAADDTTDLFVNGVEVIFDGALGTDFHCASGLPNCSQEDTVSISGGAGTNTLTFVVEQAGEGGTTDDPSGLDFSGNIVVTPEPSALSLSLLGLIFMSTIPIFKKRGITL